MNPNIIPVEPGATGPAVVELQSALSLLIERKAIKSAGGRRRPTASELKTLITKLEEDRAAATFGEATQKLLRYFQIQHGLGDQLGGVVDAKTAEAINTAIGGDAESVRRAVQGRVTDENGEPLAGAAVVALDCELRESTELGRAPTDAMGNYHIDYRSGAPSAPAINLKLEVLAADGRSLLQSDVAFDPPPVATIDLPIGGADRRQPSEFSAMDATVTPRLGRLNPAELIENDTHRDLTFLAGETGIAREHLALYAVAARMAASTGLPTELFYALLRNNVVPDAETVALASAASGVDLEANTERLQDALLAVSPAVRERAVDSAIAANLLPFSYAAQAKSDLARLDGLSATTALGSTRGFGKSSVGSVLDAVGIVPDTQRSFITLYVNSTGTDRRNFWKHLAGNPDFTSQQVADLRFGMTVGRFTSGHVPLIGELTSQRRAGRITSPRDIARWTTAQWKELLRQPVNGSPIGVPAHLATGSSDADIDSYAAELERRFEVAYPTPAFSARLAADAQTPLPAGQAVARFVDEHPSFSLQRTNIDAFGNTVPMADDVRASLLTAQRLAKLNPRYSAMRRLLADGIHSARQVYAIGASRFIGTYSAQADIGPTEAARMYQRAEQTYGMALALMTSVNDAVGSAQPAAVGGAISKELQAQLAAFPTLQTLFGADTLCACKECRSVLGPAAYLVDLLEFLRHRTAAAGTTVKDALLTRRPDIAQIELSCANTNTALPYVDLVNELLEDAVAPPADPAAAARARQTTLTTPELNANPQYVNAAAYNTLATAMYPWTLPFDLPVVEARTYLAQLGLDRVRLASTFRKPPAYPSPEANAVAAERLGFSAAEADIVTDGPLASGHQQWEYWGLSETGNTVADPVDPTATVSGSWTDVLTQTRVLLSRAKLSYQELVRLLNTRFINDDNVVGIECHPADSCSVATMTMVGLTPDVLDRLHRFVRLWRRLAWDVYDVDDAITVSQAATTAGLARLNDTLLRQLAVVSTVSKRYDMPARLAIALFGSIPTRTIPTPPGDAARASLYHDLFANLTVLSPVDPVFALDADEVEIATIATNPRLAEHAQALAAALEVSSSDLGLAVTTFTDGALTLANLSELYRHVLLARLLSVTLTELTGLLVLVEAPLDVAPFFERVLPFDGSRPEALLVFIDAVARIRQSGLSLAQLGYLLRHVQDPGATVGPDAVTVGTLLLALRNGLMRIDAETTFTPDPTGTATQRELVKLLTAADVATLMAILTGHSQLSAAEQTAVVATTLGSYTDAAAAETNLVGGISLSRGQARFEYVLRAVLGHHRRTRSAGLITQSLAQALGVEAAAAALLLSEWLPSAGSTNATALDDFLALADIARTPARASEPIAPDETGFAVHFDRYATLAKTALLISAHHLSTDDLHWWHDVGVGQGWIDPTSLPGAPTATADGRFYRWERLAAGARVRDRIRAADRSFSVLFGIAGGPTTKAEYLARLTDLTGWAADALGVFCGDPDSLSDHGSLSLVYPDDYRSERALARLLACFTIMGQTGIPADIGGWLEPTPTNAAADAIKQSVKARYPSTRWLTIAKALRDPVRERQRNALVAYLLAHPPSGAGRWLDPDDVFAHYLIDVQMAPCQATSRIVQATAAVQLFIQRCFLNLEPEVSVDVTADADWLQWQWLDQFRLWQANREVFLFPENWIDPALRREKSPFFAELEQELLQGDLTNDAAETALGNYLAKLKSVARPDVCGTYHDLSDGTDVLHVVARTQSVPPVYYHRQRIDGSRWTAWQKIELDIKSEHILPVVWNHKLYLFWTIITEKADQRQDLPPAQANAASNTTRMHYEVQLAWSRLKSPKWQAKQTVPQQLMFPRDVDPSAITLKSSFRGDTLVIDVFRGYYISTHKGSFTLAGSGDGAEVFVVSPTRPLADMSEQTRDIGLLPDPLVKTQLVPPSDARLDANTMSPMPIAQLPSSATRPRTYHLCASYDLYGVLGSEVMLNRADYYRLLVPHQTPRFDSTLPFFYGDSARQYFCVPGPYAGGAGYLTRNAPRYTYHPTYTVDYRMWPFYHPFAGLFLRELNRRGLDGLFARGLQLDPAAATATTPFDFQSYYLPSGNVMALADGTYPAEEVDFAVDGAYAYSNWELFFHAPLLIADSLSTNQRFEDAKRWYEFVFDPTSATPDPVPQRFWITKPFFQMTEPDYAGQQITALMNAVNAHDPVAEHQVAEWRKHPFDPHVIAELRPVTYQRAVLMKYIDNLIDWGDRLFRQNTMESINQATQLYVMASELLGPRPEIVEPRSAPPVKTYADLEGTIDDFANAVVAAENAIPPVRVNVPVDADSPKLPAVYTLYFRIPPNVRLLRYWDTVEDRLFKIRHCMNIEGVVQQLPLFAPPIDPGLLVRAAAAGLDLGSVLSDLDTALPPYRFATMIRLALDLCAEVRSFGSELGLALEKRDAEALSLVRSGRERQLQSKLADVRSRQIDEVDQQIDALGKSRQVLVDRSAFYKNRDLMNGWEKAALVSQAASLVSEALAAVLQGTSAVAHTFAMGTTGGAGFGGSPVAMFSLGGTNAANAASASATISRIAAAVLQTSAQMTGTLGQYHQRQDQWNLEGTLAEDEIARIDSEALAAAIRRDVASREQAVQDEAVNEAADTDDFLHTKFTNRDLFDWMVAQASTAYFQAYQLAYTVAKQAEQCFRRELAIPDSAYVQFGYWDSLRKGLTAGDKLEYDLHRLEAAYHTQNSRELEITRNVSLLQLDPYALVQLRSTGSCVLTVPELFFDLENPGHYLRRLKSVSVTVPCVIGPYASVSLSLTLLDNHVRVSTDTGAGYPRTAGTDVRFADDQGGGSSVVTSSAQNDSGLFELHLDDQRYLPFEGAGAAATWRLALDAVYPGFDYRTITDVVLHLRYTARDGGGAFATTVTDAVKSHVNELALAESRRGLYRMFSARHEYSTHWSRFLNPGLGQDQVLTIAMSPDRFPFFTDGLDIKVGGVDVLAKTRDGDDYTLEITPPGAAAVTATLTADAALGGVHHWVSPPFTPKIDLGRAPISGPPPAWQLKLKKASAPDFQSLGMDEVEEVVMIVGYQAT